MSLWNLFWVVPAAISLAIPPAILLWCDVYEPVRDWIRWYRRQRQGKQYLERYLSNQSSATTREP